MLVLVFSAPSVSHPTPNGGSRHLHWLSSSSLSKCAPRRQISKLKLEQKQQATDVLNLKDELARRKQEGENEQKKKAVPDLSLKECPLNLFGQTLYHTFSFLIQFWAYFLV